jgi:pilus assembly protein CpaF
LLNCLSAFIPEDERVIVLEDARELQLQQPHVVQLEARPPDARGKGRVSIRDLFRASLRLRPDRIVVGEIRGDEALDLIQAMTSGHDGCLSTVHASHPRDALARLETMASMGEVELPLRALRAQLASAVDIVVQTQRLQGGLRRITHVTEITGCDDERGYQLKDLFTLQADPTGQSGPLAPTGALPDCLDAIRCQGHDLPPAVYLAARRRAP